MSALPSAGSGSPEDVVRVLRAEGIRDRRVLTAFRQVPRTRFVPPAATAQAYLDEPIRIPHGQVTTQPSLIARMLAALGADQQPAGPGSRHRTGVPDRHPGPAGPPGGVGRALPRPGRPGSGQPGRGRAGPGHGDGWRRHPGRPRARPTRRSGSRPPPLASHRRWPRARSWGTAGPSGRSGGREQVTAFHKEAGQLVADAWLTPASFVPLVGAHGIRTREGRDER